MNPPDRGGAGTLCPSSRAKEGALLIGVVVGDGLAYLRPAVPLTAEDLQGAAPDVQERFRFSLPCLREKCRNFGEESCTLIQRFIERPETGDLVQCARLPVCDIRSRCEWFHTVGSRACRVCPSVRYAPSGEDQAPTAR